MTEEDKSHLEKSPEDALTVETTGTGDSSIPGDSIAQHGASMGEHCVTDRPTPSDSTSTGEISKIGDVDVYITKPSDYPHSPSKLLLFLSSGTGIYSKNNQLQADAYAAAGFLVVMPDQFGGDPAPNSSDTELKQEENPTVIEQVKIRAAETVQAFMIDMWLARQTPEKVMPILRKVVEGAEEEFADAVANGGGIYAVGYCFGGKYVLLLGSQLPSPSTQTKGATDEEQGHTTIEPLIKAGAIAHATLVTKQDLEDVKCPISMVCVENDQLFPDEIRDAGVRYLEEHKIPHESKVYPSVPHGFAVLGDYQDPKIQEAQGSAFSQMLEWLKSH